MKSKKNVTPPKRSSEVPVTLAMMGEMEGRLTHKIEGVRDELKSEIHAVRAEVNGIKSEIHEMKSEMHGMKSEIHGMKSELHRVALLVEEQNARNKYVMDGYAQIYALLTRDREI